MLPGYASTPPSDHLEDAREARLADGATAVDAFVYDWPRHLQSAVVRFEADWLRPRGVGSCYLRLPALVGSGTVLAALQYLGRSWKGPGTNRCPTVYIGNRATGWSSCYDRDLAVVQGATMVQVDRGAVDVGASAPAPNQERDGDPTWTCQGSRISTADDRVDRPDIVRAEGGSGAAYERSYLTRTRGSDCGSVVAITMDSATVIRDVLLLVLGAVVGLAAALIVEPLFVVLLDRSRRLA